MVPVAFRAPIPGSSSALRRILEFEDAIEAEYKVTTAINANERMIATQTRMHVGNKKPNQRTRG